MNKDDKISLINSYIKAYTSFEISEMLSHLHNDVKFENISNNKITARSNGLTEFKNLAEKSISFFSSRNQKITNIVFDGEKMIISIDFEGILAADLSDELKAGETLKLKGISEFTFRDNLIFSITDIS